MHSIVTMIVTLALSVATIPESDGRSDNGIAISLFKHSSFPSTDKSINSNAVDSHAASIRTKIYHRGFENREETRGIAEPSLSSEQDSGPHIVLRTDEDITFFWYCTISIGTDPQSFFVHIDTGSSDTFLPSSTCDATCNGHTLWNPTSSQTAKEVVVEDSEFNIKFAEGDIITGKKYTDNLTIGGFTADIQTIGAATSCSSTFERSSFPADGLLGLAFPSISEFHAEPLLTTLFNEGKLTNRVFSVQLTPDGGELYIGGFNTNLYDGELTFTPVTHPGYWRVDIENIQGNGKIILPGTISAIIDTGSNFIFGDMTRVEKLHEALGGKYFEDGYFTFKCNAIPDVSLTFRDRSFSIPPNVLDLGPIEDGSSDCFSGIMAFQVEENLPYWEVGGIFLQGVYTVFDFGDNPQVGFAELRG